MTIPSTSKAINWWNQHWSSPLMSLSSPYLACSCAIPTRWAASCLRPGHDVGAKDHTCLQREGEVVNWCRAGLHWALSQCTKSPSDCFVQGFTTWFTLVAGWFQVVVSDSCHRASPWLTNITVIRIPVNLPVEARNCHALSRESSGLMGASWSTVRSPQHWQFGESISFAKLRTDPYPYHHCLTYHCWLLSPTSNIDL